MLVTPNRVWGPHDISRYFDDEPGGLHLQEYGYSDLVSLFRPAGFARVVALRGIGEPPRVRPTWPHRLAEHALDLLPNSVRRRALERLSRRYPPPFRPLEQVKIAAWK